MKIETLRVINLDATKAKEKTKEYIRENITCGDSNVYYTLVSISDIMDMVEELDDPDFYDQLENLDFNMFINIESGI